MKLQYTTLAVAATAIQLATVGTSAIAADLPSLKDTPFIVMPWQGLYFGGHLGGVWGNAGVTDEFNYAGDPLLKSSANGTGLMGGAQAGYNVQRGNIVLGVEGDIGYLGLSGSSKASFSPPANYKCKDPANGNIYSAPYCGVDTQYSNSGSLYGDITGRLGFTSGNALFYAKGGAAFLNDDFKASYAGGNVTYLWGTNTPSMFHFGNSSTQLGWTLGGGVEYAMGPAWSIKAEYQHFDFGTMSYSYSGSTPVPTVPVNWGWKSYINGKNDISLTADAVSLGVNYHLDASGLK